MGDFRVVFYLYEVVSEYPKSIFPARRILLKHINVINRKILQEYFAAYGEYAARHKTEPISANYRQKKKIQILKSPFYTSPKTISATVPRSPRVRF